MRLKIGKCVSTLYGGQTARPSVVRLACDKLDVKPKAMKTAKPFGDVNTATILIIGHDPRLQHSQAEAGFAFFFDYLLCPRPRVPSEAKKYDLAQAVWGYVNDLAGRIEHCVSLSELYVTNLGNEFLEHKPGSGTVLIPEHLARRGVEQIAQIVADGHFKVILPMAVQPFYHLCRLGFVEGDSELLAHFMAEACPRAFEAEQGIYEPTGKAPFLAVCGEKFSYCGVPVVPIVHVKQWPLQQRMVKYVKPMRNAKQNIQAAIKTTRRG